MDNQVIRGSTAYRYLHEAIDVLDAAAPSLHSALLAARTAGYTHVHLDGTLIRTDRSRAIRPTAGVDLRLAHRTPSPGTRLRTRPKDRPRWASCQATAARVHNYKLIFLQDGLHHLWPR
jgi:hypothetical protein